MAQEIWLLRHGDAADADAGADDADRPLTPRGQRQARAAGKALKAMGLEFAAVLTSPRVRARDTATLAAEQLGATVEEVEALAGGFDRDDALQVMAERGADDKVLLVGHEPDFSQLAHDLAGARAQVKKGGLVGLRLGRGSGELLALMRPAELKKLG
jgi:phosphohistidine phosphatase